MSITATIERRRINGVDLHVERRGHGQRVVLVHGSWGDATNWNGVVDALADHHEVVTYDRRGHSRSGDGPGPGSRLQDAEDLAALIADLGPERAHVVGNSFGGAIVLTLVTLRPEVVASAAVHEPPVFGLLEGLDDEAVTRDLEETIRAEERVRDLLVEGRDEDAARHFVDQVAFGPGAWDLLPVEKQAMFIQNARTYLDELDDPDALTLDAAALAATTVPLRLTHGTVSPPTLLASTRQVAHLVPGAELEILDGVGHVPQLSHPQLLVESLLRFWRTVDGPTIGSAT
jgi:pimeloyl-ACP methyl ester carboxylesterase